MPEPKQSVVQTLVRECEDKNIDYSRSFSPNQITIWFAGIDYGIEFNDNGKFALT